MWEFVRYNWMLLLLSLILVVLTIGLNTSLLPFIGTIKLTMLEIITLPMLVIFVQCCFVISHERASSAWIDILISIITLSLINGILHFLEKPNIYEMYELFSTQEGSFFAGPQLASNFAIQLAVIADVTLVNILNIFVIRKIASVDKEARADELSGLRSRKKREAEELTSQADKAQTVASQI